MHDKDLLDFILLPIFAMFAGATKYLLTLKKKARFSWLFFFIESLAALVMGMIIVFLGKATKIDTYYLGALCGLSGLWGAQFFKAIIRQFIPLVNETEKNPH